MYSINSPKIKMIRNKNERIIYVLLNNWVRKTRGISRVISISKIRKIRLIRKNWTLKGIRDLESGSNPHSKGEAFSRFFKSLRDNIVLIISRIRPMRKNILAIIIIKNIIYIKVWLKFFNWKLKVINFYTI